jgi:hypothetical protein
LKPHRLVIVLHFINKIYGTAHSCIFILCYKTGISQNKHAYQNNLTRKLSKNTQSRCTEVEPIDSDPVLLSELTTAGNLCSEVIHNALHASVVLHDTFLGVGMWSSGQVTIPACVSACVFAVARFVLLLILPKDISSSMPNCYLVYISLSHSFFLSPSFVDESPPLIAKDSGFKAQAWPPLGPGPVDTEPHWGASCPMGPWGPLHPSVPIAPRWADVDPHVAIQFVIALRLFPCFC